MTKPIKYREYLGDGRWHYWGFIDGGFTGPAGIHDRHYQFTGKLDKNGQEVYAHHCLTRVRE
jgi:hypothetical protein